MTCNTEIRTVVDQPPVPYLRGQGTALKLSILPLKSREKEQNKCVHQRSGLV